VAAVAWLLREGEVLASMEVASSPYARGRGLIGRDHLEGALLLRRALSIHTVGVHFDLDVAFCDADLVVLEVVRMRRWRLGRPRMKARAVIEAEAGAFERWRLRAGDRLEVKGD
jgi:uncharacterized membrane protein (UPF0127 family)